MQVSPTQEDSFTVLRAFILNVLPDNIPVVQGQGNRVAEPQADNYVIMIPIRRERIETNVDNFHDDAYIGSISGGVLTVTRVLAGLVKPGATPTGTGVAAGTTVGAQLTGPVGGIGTYVVTPPQTLGSITLQAGAGTYLQPTKLTVQVEVHGDLSADYAQIISTMFRDEYAVDFFSSFTIGSIHPDVVPLYADDPRQLPFSNDQQQVEDRWVIEALLQVNATVIAPQQFADRVDIGLINVDSEYPP